MHVHFTAGKPGACRLRLDDVDITDAVMAKGFSITVDDFGQAEVALRLRADRLTVDGEAVIEAARLERADLIAAATADTEQEAS